MQPVGIRYYYGFLRRAGLSERTPKTDKTHNEEVVPLIEEFLVDLLLALDGLDIDAVINMDETHASKTIRLYKRVIAKIGTRHVAVHQGGRLGERHTVVLTVTMTGSFLPVFVIHSSTETFVEKKDVGAEFDNHRKHRLVREEAEELKAYQHDSNHTDVEEAESSRDFYNDDCDMDASELDGDSVNDDEDGANSAPDVQVDDSAVIEMIIAKIGTRHVCR